MMEYCSVLPAFSICLFKASTSGRLPCRAKPSPTCARRKRGRASCSAEALNYPQGSVREERCVPPVVISSRKLPLSSANPAVTSADAELMQVALSLAREAYAAGEVPVGAVLVDKSGAIIGRGRNRVEALGDSTAHAEMEALRAQEPGGHHERGWRRIGCTLYTTLEPCAMCFSAASLARVRRIVYGAPDLRLGACGTWIDLRATSHPFHTLEDVTSGVCALESAALMKKFFRERRRQPKFT